MTIVNEDVANRELSIEELDPVAGGDWSWKGFFGAVAGGAATGAMGGAAVGGVGAGPGAIGGGLTGGIGYCIGAIIDLF
jgi:hypothetical protein